MSKRTIEILAAILGIAFIFYSVYENEKKKAMLKKALKKNSYENR